MCDIGEVAFYYVPKKRRGIMSARWRVCVFLGRSWNSDQNIIGLSGGSVTTARSMARVVEQRRWCRERIQRITTTPLKEKPTNREKLEDGHAPHEGLPKP